MVLKAVTGILPYCYRQMNLVVQLRTLIVFTDSRVNGRPDLNKMHTAIDMGSNNLNNVGAVNAQTGNFSGNVNGVNGTFSGQVKGNSGNFDVNVTAGGDIRSNNGWLITRNSKGWLNETHGGGFYMSDGSWVRSVNNKGIYTGGQVKGGTVRADGRLYTGEYLQLERTAVAGASCSPNGLVGRDNTGAILSCQSGTWGTIGGKLNRLLSFPPQVHHRGNSTSVPLPEWATQRMPIYCIGGS